MQKFKNLFSKKKPAEVSEPAAKGEHKSHIPFRLNLLFFVIFALFVMLIAQLGNLQIIESEQLETRMHSSSVLNIQVSTPRGIIYDANGKALVENTANPAITFTRGFQTSASDMLDTAYRLNELIAIDVNERLTQRDLIDFWLANPDNLKIAQERLAESGQEVNADEEYNYLVELVSDEEIQFSQTELEVATIFTRLNSAQQLTTIFVKNEGVTNEEIALVSERAQELPGISTGVDWDRNIVTEVNSIGSLIGRISRDGLQAENAEEFLAKGYSLTDRVGTSFLEQQYELELQGVRSEQEITINQAGQIESQREITPGEKGSNLVLTIDSEFQAKVDDIVRTTFQGLIDSGAARYSPGIYVAAMNPTTGEILAMSGYSHDIETNEMSENVLGVYQRAFEPGSVMKAGTITAGWESGVISGNQVLYDQPIRLQGANPKASIFNLQGFNNRNLNVTQALEVSSNSFMMQIALKLLGIDYTGQTLAMPSVTRQGDAFDQLRTAFGEFGLGVSTGIDLPNEFEGYIPDVSTLSDENNDAAKILDLAFGQFDTYTAMQLLQYVSTIANDGVRMQPHIVAGIYDNDEQGNLGERIESIGPTEMNRVNISDENMQLLQQGFFDVVHGTDPNTTGRALQNSKIQMAAKSGTAESVVFDNGRQIDVDNLNMVAYGPYNDPEIAIAVVIPQVVSRIHGSPNITITNKIMDAYYEMFMANR